MSPRKVTTVKPPSNRRWFIIAGIAVVGLGLWVAVGRPLQLRNRARKDAQLLVQAVNVYVREQGAVPEGNFATICRLLRGETVGDQNSKRLDYVEAAPSEINAQGEFIDPWGTPYRLTFDKLVRAYSCGPNKLDEAGQGDDIVAE